MEIGSPSSSELRVLASSQDPQSREQLLADSFPRGLFCETQTILRRCSKSVVEVSGQISDIGDDGRFDHIETL